MAAFDPRRTITEESFAIDPALLGLPLARPMRRLVAIGVDLLIVSVLVNAGGGFWLGLVAAYVFFRLARRITGTGRGIFGRMARWGFYTVGGLILFGVGASLWGRVADGWWFAEKAATHAPGVGPSARMAMKSAFDVGRAAGELQDAESENEAREVGERFASSLSALGTDGGEIRAALDDLARESEREFVRKALAEVAAGITAHPDSASLRDLPADSLVAAYAVALSAGDSARAAQVRPVLASRLAADSLRALRAEVADLAEDKDDLRQALFEERERGFLKDLFEWLDELGIGLGWTGLYFTAFTYLWKGRTPGKRLMGIRVLRLNGQPMTLWMSFERFGGYAAGLVTGLLGFAQVIWDRNRQAIHDKITETVVVREPKQAG